VLFGYLFESPISKLKRERRGEVLDQKGEERMRKQALNLGRGYFGYRQPVIETSFLGLMAFRLLALTSWL